MAFTPDNYNLLAQTGFKVLIQRAPNVQYFCQRVSIPSITVGGAVPVPTPFSDHPIPGDKLVFSELSISFLIDEELSNYREIRDWLVAMSFPENFGQYNTLEHRTSETSGNMYSDITIMSLTNNMNGNYKFVFKDAFPTSLGTIEFDTKSNLEELEVEVIFAYMGNFDIIKV